MKRCLCAYVKALPFSKASKCSEVIVQDSSSLASSIWYYLEISQTTATKSQCLKVIFQVLQQPRWVLALYCVNGTVEQLDLPFPVCCFQAQDPHWKHSPAWGQVVIMISIKYLACFEKNHCSGITRTCESTCLGLIFLSAVLSNMF